MADEKYQKYPNPAEIILGFLNVLVLIVITLISIRFILELFGANAQAPFTQWVYESTTQPLAPFHGIFQAAKLGKSYVIDFTSLFAIFAYSFLWYLIQYVLDTLEYNRRRMKS